MPRYFLNIAFDGARFHGWQRQPGDVSVQQTLEEALEKILRRPTPLTGAGRTDAGVNARMMPAHFDTEDPIADPGLFLRSLNALAGPEISIADARQVAPDAHARFDATKRTYRYFAVTHKDPFLRSYAWQCSPRLHFEAMNTAAELLLDTRDFAAFAKAHSDAKTTICHVTAARWITLTPGVHAFEISADRFLRNMVRAVVGTLVEVGRGKLSVSDFADVIASGDRSQAGTSMPAHALFLWDVQYPYLDFNTQSYSQCTDILFR